MLYMGLDAWLCILELLYHYNCKIKHYYPKLLVLSLEVSGRASTFIEVWWIAARPDV